MRHNAHDCIYPDHEKDFRVLQLFARRFMQGRLLVVLRLSHQGVVEVDTVRGTGALELGLCGATAQPPPRRFSLFVPLSEMDSEVIRTLRAVGPVSVRPLPDVQGGLLGRHPNPVRPCRLPAGFFGWGVSLLREHADLLFLIAWEPP